MRGWALGDVPQADPVSPRFLEGLPQAPEDIRVVLGRGAVAGVDSQGVERPGSTRDHGKRHPEPWKQPVTGEPVHSPGGGHLPSRVAPQLKPQG